MMLNKVILQGRLTANPELKVTTSGLSVTTFSLAVDQRDRERDAYFFNVVAWRGTAEFICKYFSKGSQILICGELSQRKYTAQDGSNRSVTEVIAGEAFFCGGRQENTAPYTAQSPAPSSGAAAPKVAPVQQTKFEEIDDDQDLPF